MEIFIPPRLEAFSALKFARELRGIQASDDLIINFDQLDFARPFGTLVAAQAIREMARFRRKTSLPTAQAKYKTSRDVVGYLGHIGFFKHSGISYGNEPGAARGSSTYLPLHHIIRRNLTRSVGEDAPLGQAVEEEAVKLTELIVGGGRIITSSHPVAYCFREIIRNTFEHADANVCTISAQKWGAKTIQIALYDEGQGIRSSLNQKYSLNTDGEALAEAIKPGISRIDFGSQEDSEWANSGYGLYVMSELAARTGGAFLACSGKSAILRSSGVTQVYDHEFNGTAIMLTVSKPHGVNLNDLLSEIVRDGELQAPLGSKTASASTKSISNAKSEDISDPF